MVLVRNINKMLWDYRGKNSLPGSGGRLNRGCNFLAYYIKCYIEDFTQIQRITDTGLAKTFI